MIHYDDRGGNYDFNSKSCNLFSTIRFFSFFFFLFFQHGVEIVSPPSSSPFFLRFDFVHRRGGFRFDSRHFNVIFLPISCYNDSTLTFNPTLVSSKNPINRRGKREGKKKKYNQSESTLQRKETVKETLANRHVYARPSIECQ